METIKKAAVSTKKFVYKHRVAITATVTTAICLKLNQMALADHDNFLKEEGLYEKFYTPSDEEMGA